MNHLQVFFRGEWRTLRSYADAGTARAALETVRRLEPALGFRIQTGGVTSGTILVSTGGRAGQGRSVGPAVGVALVALAFAAVLGGTWWGASRLSSWGAEAESAPDAVPTVAPRNEADLKLSLDCAALAGAFGGDAARGRPFLEIARAIAPGLAQPDADALKAMRTQLLQRGPEWAIAQIRRCKTSLPDLSAKYR